MTRNPVRALALHAQHIPVLPGGWSTAAAGTVVLAGAGALSVGIAFTPYLTIGVGIGLILTLFALTHPLALVGFMLMLGPADLSALTGGFKSMFAQLGGLDMNGIRLLGMSAALSLTVLADPDVRRQVLRPAALFYVLLLAYGGATLALSPDPLEGLRLLLKIAYPLLVFLVITGLSPDRSRLDRLMDAVLIGTAILCVVINPLYQIFGDFERDIGGWRRLRGVGTHQNPFAFYLIAAMLMSFVRYTTRREARYLLLSALAGVWMVLTVTRIAFLAAVVSLLCVGIVTAYTTKQTRALVIALVLGAILTIPFAPAVLERSLGFVPSPGELIALLKSPQTLVTAINWEGRQVFWAIVYQAYITSPILGLGLGASSHALAVYFPWMNAPVVHNDYLRLLCDTGVIGVVLFTAALTAFTTAVLRALPIPDRTVREYGVPAIGCLGALAIIGITDNVFDYYGPFTQYIGFLCAGTVAAAAAWKREEGSGDDVQPATPRLRQVNAGGSR